MEWRFKTPERKTVDGDTQIFQVLFETPYIVPVELQWNGGEYLPDLAFEHHVKAIQKSILEAVVKNPALFRTPPTLRALQSITPVWGVVVHEGGKLSWSPHVEWPRGTKTPDKMGVVQMKLCGIQISRSSILPVWEMVMVRLTDKSPDRIDLCFDGSSVCSSDIEEEGVGSEIESDEHGTAIQLRNMEIEKHKTKGRIRQMQQQIADLQLAVDDAIDRFFTEYDLSEDESDFSDA